jgi:hypothetical protein
MTVIVQTIVYVNLDDEDEAMDEKTAQMVKMMMETD